MTVRWKPMILLTVLFVGLAAGGLFAFTRVMFPARAEDLLPPARAEVKARKFDRAEIQYRRALQRDPKNAAIHLELARMFESWAQAQPKQAAKHRANRINSLQEAAKYGKQLAEPRRLLLADALATGEWGDCVYWARELYPLEKSNLDARYVLAAESLESEPPDVAEARSHLQVIGPKQPDRLRTLWLQARLAQASHDTPALESHLNRARGAVRAESGEDALCGVRLRTLDVEQATEVEALSPRVEAFRAEAMRLARTELQPARARDLMRLLERVQRHLNASTAKAPAIAGQGDALAELAELTFRQAVESSQGADLRPHQSYAGYLLYLGHRARCMEVVADALQRPAAKAAFWTPAAMELREMGVKAALSDAADATRIEKAKPWIDDLLAATNARYRALGHLFQGVIDLELSGLGGKMDQATPNTPAHDPARSRSAVAHLKEAAAGLSDVATAQALYGVSLLLTGEPVLGRQYLQAAQRGGNGKLDPRYQIWAALSVLQAGYPEDAQPIIEALLAPGAAVPAQLAPSLHVIRAEILQARATPESLKEAYAAYQTAFQLGQKRTPAMELRLAQLAALMGDASEALKAIERLSDDAQAGPSAERIAALTLFQQGKPAEAAARLDQARRKFPDSAELVELAVALKVQLGKASEADPILQEFLTGHPDHEDLALLRAKLLSESLDRGDEARALVQRICETSKNSAPWILRAHLELGAKEYEAAAKTIEHIRTQWPDAAASDLLSAQGALAQGNLAAAGLGLEAALKKDPNNKVALFWKARLDEQTGSTAQAQAVFEKLARERSLKEIENGLPLGTAAQWALASMALENRQFDVAVSRYESLLREVPSDAVARPARWNLALARAAKGQVAEAKAEVIALLRDPNSTAEERVQGADFLRRHGDEAAAAAQIDLILKSQPTHPGAITYRALLLMEHDKSAEAAAMVRAAIAAGKAPAGLYLLLAALENQGGPTGLPRARQALEDGLAAHPDHAELIRARYQIMSLMKDPQAIALLENAASANPAGPAAGVLIEAYRDRRQFDKAAVLVATRLKGLDKASAEARDWTRQGVTLLAAQAEQARQQGDSATEKRCLDEAARALAAARTQAPDDLSLLELEGDLAIQQRDLGRAHRIAQDIASRDKSTPAGALLLARIAGAENKPREAARAYEQAVERSPGRTDLRLALAKAQLSMGAYDDAVRQASWVLETEHNQPEARFVKAQALARADGTPEEVQARRKQAVALLEAVLDDRPNFADAAHLLSDLYVLMNDRARAVTLLRRCIEQAPADEAGFSLLVQRLAEAPASLDEASRLAEKYTSNDSRGAFALAAAVGFHRAGHPELALPWAEKAVATLDQPMVHLTVGDILLACAEQNAKSAEAQAWFNQAIDHYDKVLAARPQSIEAINNKAWILHRYLNRNDEALKVANAANDADPATLPADFHDTLGAILEAAGKHREAESSYARGLRIAPDHPVLNFHMGRLLKRLGKDANRADTCLAKAAAARAELPSDMAAELAVLAGH